MVSNNEQEPKAPSPSRFTQTITSLLGIAVKILDRTGNILVYLVLVLSPIIMAFTLSNLGDKLLPLIVQGDIGNLFSPILTIGLSFFLLALSIDILLSRRRVRTIADKLILMKKHPELFKMLRQDLNEILAEKIS